MVDRMGARSVGCPIDVREMSVGILLMQIWAHGTRHGRDCAENFTGDLTRDLSCELSECDEQACRRQESIPARDLGRFALVAVVRRCQESNDSETSRMRGVYANVRSTWGAQPPGRSL